MVLTSKEPNVFANGRERHFIARVVELKGAESFVLDIVTERDVEPSRASEAARRSAAATEEFR
jgi:hypothetical protein